MDYLNDTLIQTYLALYIVDMFVFFLSLFCFIFFYLELCFLKNLKKIYNEEQIVIDIFFFLSCFCIGYISARYFLLF